VAQLRRVRLLPARADGGRSGRQGETAETQGSARSTPRASVGGLVTVSPALAMSGGRSALGGALDACPLRRAFTAALGMVLPDASRRDCAGDACQEPCGWRRQPDDQKPAVRPG